jgi:hypothetical protein
MNEAQGLPVKRPPRLRAAMRLATPIGLIALAGAGSAYALLVDRTVVSDADRAARPSDVFPSFRLERVRRVKLTQGKEELVIERDNDDGAPWTLTSSRHAKKETADPATVDVLLRELELARRVRDVAPDQARGLAVPRVRGDVTVGAVDYSFALGDDAPTPAGSAYMELNGEGTFVVGATLKVQLLRPADTYRERAVVPYGAADVNRVEASTPHLSFAIERAGDTFRLGGPRGVRAARTAVEKLFSALAEMRADRFVDDEEARAAEPGPPSLSVIVMPRVPDLPAVRFDAYGACPEEPHDVVAIRAEPSALAVCVPEDATAALQWSDAALADKHPFFAHADEIEELLLESVAAERPRVEIVRRGAGWRERAPEAHDLSSEEDEAANVLLADLAAAQALSVRPRQPDDRFVATARATIERTEAGSEVLEIAAADRDGTALALRKDDGAILRLPRALARRFAPHPIALRSLTVFPLGFDAGSVTRIDDACGSTPEHLELQNGRWIRPGRGAEADAYGVTDLLRAFAHAKAHAWLTEADDEHDPTLGLDPAHACTISFRLTPAESVGPPRTVGVAFGAEADGGYYARTLDSQAIFVAPAPLREWALHPWATHPPGASVPSPIR